MPFYDQLVSETAAQRELLIEVPQLQAGLAGHISRAAYVDYLTQAYHHVRHTVPLLRLARQRLEGNALFCAALDEYIAEESGHEQWILNDIAAAGGDRAAAARSDPGDATAEMVRHAYERVGQGNPVSLFGMVFVLEGTSVAMASRGAASIQRSLGLPDRAFTYLTSHGALDQEHLRFFASLMDRVEDAADQQAIIDMARDMYGLFADMFRGIDLEVRDAAA
jgi:pyrroloquinoline quinone (PQQ) biosynthesis protein C